MLLTLFVTAVLAFWVWLAVQPTNRRARFVVVTVSHDESSDHHAAEHVETPDHDDCATDDESWLSGTDEASDCDVSDD